MIHSGRSELPPESPSGVVVAVSGAALDRAHVRGLLGSPQTVDQALDLILSARPPKFHDSFALDAEADGLIEQLSTLLLQTSSAAWPRRERLLRCLVALRGATACWRLYTQLRQSDLAAARSSLLGLSPIAERVALLHAQVGFVTRSLRQDAPLLATAFSPLLSTERDAAALLAELYLDAVADCARSTAGLIKEPDTQTFAPAQTSLLPSAGAGRKGSRSRPAVNVHGVNGGHAVPSRASANTPPSGPLGAAAAVLLPPVSRMDWPEAWRVAEGVADALQRVTACVDMTLASSPWRVDGTLPTPRLRSGIALPSSPVHGDGELASPRLRSGVALPSLPLRSGGELPSKPLGISESLTPLSLRNGGALTSPPSHSGPALPSLPLRGSGASLTPPYPYSLSPAHVLAPHTEAICAAAKAHVRSLVAWAIEAEMAPPAALRSGVPPPRPAHDGVSRGHRLAATAAGDELVLTSVATILSSLRLHLPGSALLGQLPHVNETLAAALQESASVVGQHLTFLCGRVGSPPGAEYSPTNPQIGSAHSRIESAHPRIDSAHPRGDGRSCHQPIDSSSSHPQIEGNSTYPPHALPQPPPAPLDTPLPPPTFGSYFLFAAVPSSLPTSILAICLSSARALDFFFLSLTQHNQPSRPSDAAESTLPPAESLAHPLSRAHSWSPAAAARLSAARANLRMVEGAIHQRLCVVHAQLASACALAEPHWLSAGQGRPASHRPSTGASAGCSYGMLLLASGLATLRAELRTHHTSPARPLLLRTLRLASFPLVAAYWAHPPAAAAAAASHRADVLFLVMLVLTLCPEVVQCVGAQGKWARKAVAPVAGSGAGGVAGAGGGLAAAGLAGGVEGGVGGVAEVRAACAAEKCGAQGEGAACRSAAGPTHLFSTGASEIDPAAYGLFSADLFSADVFSAYLFAADPFPAGASEIDLMDADTRSLAAAVLCLISLVGLAHAPVDRLVLVASGWRLGTANGRKATASAGEGTGGGGGENTGWEGHEAGGVVSASDWASIGARVLARMTAQGKDESGGAPTAGEQLAALLGNLGGGGSVLTPPSDPVSEHLQAVAMAARAAATELDWDGLLGAMPLQAEPALLRKGLGANAGLRSSAEGNVRVLALARERDGRLNGGGIGLSGAMPVSSRAIASARPGTTASRRHRDANWAYEAADEAQEERALAVSALEHELAAHEQTRRKLQAAAQGSSQFDRAVIEATEAHVRLVAIQVERQREVAALGALLDAARAAERRARLAAADASARQQHESDAAAAALAEAERGRQQALATARHCAFQMEWSRRSAGVDVATLAIEIRDRESSTLAHESNAPAQAARTRSSAAVAVPSKRLPTPSTSACDNSSTVAVPSTRLPASCAAANATPDAVAVPFSAGVCASAPGPSAAVPAAGLASAARTGHELFLEAGGLHEVFQEVVGLQELLLVVGELQAQVSSLAAAAAAADRRAAALEEELAFKTKLEEELASKTKLEEELASKTKLEEELAYKRKLEAHHAAAAAAAAGAAERVSLSAVASRAEERRVAAAAAAEKRVDELCRRNGVLEERLAIAEAAAGAAVAGKEAAAAAGAAVGATERRALTRCLLVAMQEEESGRVRVARCAVAAAAEAKARESEMKAELECARKRAAALVGEVEGLRREREERREGEEKEVETRKCEQKSLLCNFASLSSSLSDALAEARSSLSHHELRHAREAALAEEADALRQAAREQEADLTAMRSALSLVRVQAEEWRLKMESAHREAQVREARLVARAAAAEAAAERERQRNIAAATAVTAAGPRGMAARGSGSCRSVAQTPPPATTGYFSPQGYSYPQGYSIPHGFSSPTQATPEEACLHAHPTAIASGPPQAELFSPDAAPACGLSAPTQSNKSNDVDVRSRLEAAASSLHQTVAAALLPSEAAARESRQREGQAAAALLALRIAVAQRDDALAEAQAAAQECEARQWVEAEAMAVEVAGLEQKLDAARMSARSAEARRGTVATSGACDGDVATSPIDTDSGTATSSHLAPSISASPATHSQGGSPNSRRGPPSGAGEGGSRGSPSHARGGSPLAAAARAAAAATRGTTAHGAGLRTAHRPGTFPFATPPLPPTAEAPLPVSLPDHTSPRSALSHVNSHSHPLDPTTASLCAERSSPAAARFATSPSRSAPTSHSSLRVGASPPSVHLPPAHVPSPPVQPVASRPAAQPTCPGSPRSHRSPATPRTHRTPAAPIQSTIHSSSVHSIIHSSPIHSSVHSPTAGRDGSPSPSRSSRHATPSPPRNPPSPRRYPPSPHNPPLPSADALQSHPPGAHLASPHAPTLADRLTKELRRSSSLTRQLDDAYEDLATARAVAAEATAAGRRGLAAAAMRERAITQAVLQELRRHGAEASILVTELGHVEGSSAAGVLASPEVGEMVASLELERMHACELAGQQTAALAQAEDRAWVAERREAVAVQAAREREEQVARLVGPEAALRTAAHVSQLAWSRAAAEGWSLANREAAWRAVGEGEGIRSLATGRGRRGRKGAAAVGEGYSLSFLEGEEADRDAEDE